MKYAIIMTGQLRTWKFLQPMIENLRENNDIDFFLSINQDQNQYNIKEVLEFYKPISYYNDQYNENIFYNHIKNIKDFSYKYQEKFEINKDELLEKSFDSHKVLKFKFLYKESKKKSKFMIFDKSKLKNRIEQYFFVYKGYELLENHIKNNNINYDSVIRLRFDQLIWNDKFYFDIKPIIVNDENKEKLIRKLKNIKIKLDIPEFNEIYLFNGGVFNNYAYVNDQFWCHNINKFNIMKEFYLYLPYIIKSSFNKFWPCHGCSPEHFLAKYLSEENHDFIIKKSLLKGIFIRNL